MVTTCLNSVGGVSKGMLPVKYFFVVTTCLNSVGGVSKGMLPVKYFFVVTTCLNSVGGLSKGMLPVKYFFASNPLYWRSNFVIFWGCHKVEVNLSTLICWGILPYLKHLSLYLWGHCSCNNKCTAQGSSHGYNSKVKYVFNEACLWR